jgi:hypothetical protein
VRRLIYEEILEFHPLERDRYYELRSIEARGAEFHRQQAAVSGIVPSPYDQDYNRRVC